MRKEDEEVKDRRREAEERGVEGGGESEGQGGGEGQKGS